MHARVRLLLGCLGVALFATAARAATFVPEGEALRIYGDIEPGDDAKFLALWGQGYAQLRVQSLGGDTQATLAIGEAIAKVQPLIVVDGLCLSNCATMIFLASKSHRVLREGLVCFDGPPPPPPLPPAPADAEASAAAAPTAVAADAPASAEAAVAPAVELNYGDDAKPTPAPAPTTVRGPAQPVALKVPPRPEISKDVQPRVDALLKANEVDPKILKEDALFVSREFVEDSEVTREQFLRGKRSFWCPLPEAFTRYGVTGHWDWFPASDRALFDYGKRMSSGWVMISRLKGRGELGR
ncbi:hypothetical protein [Roseiterribacter gracilis]|uniref:Uncharacterized protein n=1 Tax=Roseiterribacter gracilis TaxID=2812848 RepID=A0A8S8XJ61_9PROT|nr:hypothetical protein TMPK1_34630 [Rhodospirillales bacterium TMPK1]